MSAQAIPSSMALSTALVRRSMVEASSLCTMALPSLSSVSSHTVVRTSASTTPSRTSTRGRKTMVWSVLAPSSLSPSAPPSSPVSSRTPSTPCVADCRCSPKSPRPNGCIRAPLTAQSRSLKTRALAPFSRVSVLTCSALWVVRSCSSVTTRSSALSVKASGAHCLPSAVTQCIVLGCKPRRKSSIICWQPTVPLKNTYLPLHCSIQLDFVVVITYHA